MQDHPEWIGREGQIGQFVNRYIDSLETGKPAPDDMGQAELVFAKRYAQYLVDYERALAGGARGFTVQFQKRFNALLDQNQFNSAGFDRLMNDQLQTIANQAAAKSGAVNKNNLTQMAYDFSQRAEDEDATKNILGTVAKGGAGESHPNVTQEEYSKLKPGELYWWNGKQIPKKG